MENFNLNRLVKSGIATQETSNYHVRFCINTSWGCHISIVVGSGNYCSPRDLNRDMVYEEVEIAFLDKSGNFISPTQLPFWFPTWDGCVFAYVPVKSLIRLLPLACPHFDISTL